MADDILQNYHSPPHPRVLAVDDDADIHLQLKPYLEQQRYHYTSAADGSEMLAKLTESRADLILLDVMLPGKDGLDLMADIRGVSKAPIILLSGRASSHDKIVGLEMGADDFVAKPVEPRELTARIKAILRRGASEVEAEMTLPKARRVSFGDWVLDRQQYQLFDKNGKSADLTLGEFRLLETLILAPECVLSREQLFELTRSGTLDACERAIDAQIARIRKKLHVSRPARPFIKTIRKVGYMFCGKPEIMES
ncbi:MAG TPA: response regulator transcription factor [Patescibacteria group bacterium]|nr:response regulator transcription factor [Patescibacteria group bacterium]